MSVMPWETHEFDYVSMQPSPLPAMNAPRFIRPRHFGDACTLHAPLPVSYPCLWLALLHSAILAVSVAGRSGRQLMALDPTDEPWPFPFVGHGPHGRPPWLTLFSPLHKLIPVE